MLIFFWGHAMVFSSNCCPCGSEGWHLFTCISKRCCWHLLDVAWQCSRCLPVDQSQCLPDFCKLHGFFRYVLYLPPFDCFLWYRELLYFQTILFVYLCHPPWGGGVGWHQILKKKKKNHITIQTRVLQFPSVFSFSRFIVSGCWFVCGVGDCTQGRTHGRLVAYSGTTAPARLQPGVKSCCVLS